MDQKDENYKHIESFLNRITAFDSEKMMNMVDKHLDAESVELFVDHIEDFYGIKDEEELGLLAQIIICGYVCAKEQPILN